MNFHILDFNPSDEAIKSQNYYTLQFHNNMISIFYSFIDKLEDKDLLNLSICPCCKQSKFMHLDECKHTETEEFNSAFTEFQKTIADDNTDYHYTEYLKRAESHIDKPKKIPKLAELISMDYDKLLMLDIIYNYKVSEILNANGYAYLTVCPECQIDDFIHMEDCSKQK